MSGIEWWNNEIIKDSQKKLTRKDVIEDWWIEEWVTKRVNEWKKQDVAKNFHTLLEFEKLNVQFVKEKVFDVLNDEELSEVVSNMDEGWWVDWNSEDYADLLISTVNGKWWKKAGGVLLDKTPYLLNKYKNAFKKSIMRENLINNAKSNGFDNLLMRSHELVDGDDIKYVFNNYPKRSRSIVNLMKAFENPWINSVIDADSISIKICEDVKDLLGSGDINSDQAKNLSDWFDKLIKRIKSEKMKNEIKDLQKNVDKIIENPDEILEKALNELDS